MTSSIDCACVGRGAAYVGYNVPGVSFIVGLVRLVVAAFFLAKLHIDHKYRPQSLSVRQIDFEDNKRAWKDVAIHGGIELIPIFGPAFFTYIDNKGRNNIFNRNTTTILHLTGLKNLIRDSW